MGEETKAHGIRFKGPNKEKHKRTITIDDDLLALLLSARDRLLRLKAGIPDGVAVDLSPVVPYKGRASAKTIAREFSCLFKETECAVSPGTGGDLNKSEKSEDTGGNAAADGTSGWLITIPRTATGTCRSTRIVELIRHAKITPAN